MHHLITAVHDKAGRFLEDHATTILTAGGVIGTGMTAVLSAKAGIKAGRLLEIEDQSKAEAVLEGVEHPEYTTREKLKQIGPLFIPPAIVGTATIGSIVAANMMSAKRAAALAAAYGISERNLREYKDKVQEKLSPAKKTQIQDEIAQDRVNENPPTKEVIILAGGDVLCFDMHTGRYFRSTVDRIKKAENTINQELFHHEYDSLSHFYDEIGLPPTSFSDAVGWNSQTGALDVQFSTTMSPSDEPCIAIDFVNPPKTEYTKLY